MAEKICAICGQRRYPHEAQTNEMVAQAARLPGIGPQVWRMVWPDITASDCQLCGNPLVFRACRTGADWVLTCPAGHVARQAEHKPGGAPGQWSRATADDYKREVREGLIVPAGIGAPFPHRGTIRDTRRPAGVPDAMWSKGRPTEWFS